MKHKNLIKRVIAGTVICGLLGMSVCSAGTFTANAAPAAAAGSHPNKNSSIIPGKEKKNNGKKVNQENDSQKNWNQKMIQAEEKVTEGKKVKVAIIDSGVNCSSDIDVFERKNFIEDDECSILYEDASGHGTAIAGIIAALDNDEGITGVNPNVEIYSARVLDDDLTAPVKRIVAAIDWAIEKDVDIINMSFGIPSNHPELYEAIVRATERGALLVASAGQNGEVVYPAAYEEVIAVGAVDAMGNAQASSPNGYSELMAPGVNILSSAIFDGVLGGSGTSLSTAHVCGVASVLMEQNPEMPAEFVRALMDYSANLYGDSDFYGNGVVDLDYAMTIAPSFKKVYEKYQRKINQNEVQKMKEKEKFWGEIIRTIPENEKDIETFDNLENVVGMWSGPGHQDLTEYAAENASVTLTAEQLEILIAGCKYPDKLDSGMNDMEENPYHGYFRHGKDLKVPSNYLANYIYLTRIAANGGSISGVSSVSGITTTDKEIIDSHFQSGMVGAKTYAQAFSSAKLSNYSSTDITNRKLFVYGIAMHLVGDIYAHSTFRFDGTNYVRNEHNNFHCDEPENYPNRYNAAKEVMKHVIVRVNNNSEGMLQDFGISTGYYGTTNADRFYLNCLVLYAKEVDPILYSQWARYYSYYYTSFNYGSINAGINDTLQP